MRRRAFVVAPFGVKEVAAAREDAPAMSVNFDDLYEQLLRPAIEQTGCEAFRADEEAGAGDIRIDMFFELVTADVVVADISILNPNVFYELGVRHGVAPRGVFMVHAGWSRRPFDVAPDRTFGYDGTLFEPSTERDGQWEQRVHSEVASLADKLRRALEVDQQGVGSPVYAALPGLKPVDWTGLDSARAKYFTGVLDEWGTRVRIAQKNGHAGDILTLAEDAPTRFHRGKLLLAAGKALAQLGRYRAARGVLAELLGMEPDNFVADCQMGLVLGRLGRVAEAEEHMRRVAALRPGDPEAAGMLGRVYKDMWRARWEPASEPEERQQAALVHSGLAAFAVRSYRTAFQAHLDYYNGVNLVTLVRLLEHVANLTGQRPATLPAIAVHDVGVAVRLAATVALERAAGCSDNDEEIWAAATLGELAVVDGDPDEAARRYADAAGVPGVSYFHLDSMLSQLTLYRQLGFQGTAVDAAATPLEAALGYVSGPAPRFAKILVASGHMIDAPDRPKPRFPPEKEATVRDRIAAILDGWGAGDGDLAICGGARGADMLFAELCVDRGVHVRLAIPTAQSDFLSSSVRLDGSDWETRFFELLDRCEVVYQAERLGAAPDGTSVFARNNRWIINMALTEADVDATAGAAQQLCAMLVWDEQPTADGPGGTSDFAASAKRLGGHLQVVNPTKLSV
ncbi:MAG: tetratricopeptide repeat-containing protein [Solirubrobacteraceae bacterium]